MTLVLLNNVDHHDLRVRPPAGSHGGAEAIQVLAFAGEFEELHRHYPIVFRKSTEGPLRPVAILGLAEKENLFTDRSGRWLEHIYIPALLQRGPLALARSEGEETAPRILVDPDHPSISRDEGEPLFLPRGGSSPFLDRTIGVLGTIFEGESQANSLIAAFERADILKPANLQIRTGEDEIYAISDIQIVDRQTLAGLDERPLQDLHHAGFLAHAFLAAASLGNLQHLAERKASLSHSPRP